MALGASASVTGSLALANTLLAACTPPATEPPAAAAPTSAPAATNTPAAEATAMPAERIALAAQRRENALVDAHFRAGSGGTKRIAWLGLVALVAIALLVVALPVAAQPASPGGEAGLPLLVGQSAGSTSCSMTPAARSSSW